MEKSTFMEMLDKKLTPISNDVKEIRNDVRNVEHRLSDKIDALETKVYDKLDEHRDRFLPNRVFYWVAGIIFTVMVLFGGNYLLTRNIVQANTVKIEQVYKDGNLSYGGQHPVKIRDYKNDKLGTSTHTEYFKVEN